jgi:hypothetical protein
MLSAGCPGTLDEAPSDYLSAIGGHDANATDAASSEAATGAETSSSDAPGCPDVESTLHANCGFAGCHASSMSAAGLDLASPGILGRLSGQKASGGGVLVQPGDPDHSVLYQKLLPTPPYGSRMPLGGALDDATIACVRAWVSADTSEP